MNKKFPIDILKLLYEKKISEDEAYDLKGEIVSFFHKEKTTQTLRELMKMDHYEWTATVHCGLSNTAKFRYEGWPERCPFCHRKIIKEKGGWRCKGNGPVYGPFAHISCDENYLRKIGYTEEEIADKK